MRLFLLALLVITSQSIAGLSAAQSPHAKKAPYTSSPYTSGMNHVTVGKSARAARMLNKINPAAGQTVLSKADQDALNAMAAKVWHKYRTLTSGTPSEGQRKHLSISSPQEVKNTIRNKKIAPKHDIPPTPDTQDFAKQLKPTPAKAPSAGISALLKSYEERKAARGYVGSVKLND